jgi:ribonuclease HII
MAKKFKIEFYLYLFILFKFYIMEVLKTYYNEDPLLLEIGIDEAGRGPLFGRVYAAAVILPKDSSFDHSRMKDSKKFHSKKKITEVAEYIKENAVSWGVAFEDEKIIDQINILQATQSAMHKAIKECMVKAGTAEIARTAETGLENNKYQLLVDGNYFKSYTSYNKERKMMESTPHLCVEGGDRTYTSIAAASILAKVTRDTYIDDLCEENPTLGEYYGIDSNKGYGAKKHRDGIKEHGITIWHRRSFGICKEYA